MAAVLSHEMDLVDVVRGTTEALVVTWAGDAPVEIETVFTDELGGAIYLTKDYTVDVPGDYDVVGGAGSFTLVLHPADTRVLTVPVMRYDVFVTVASGHIYRVQFGAVYTEAHASESAVGLIGDGAGESLTGLVPNVLFTIPAHTPELTVRHGFNVDFARIELFMKCENYSKVFADYRPGVDAMNEVVIDWLDVDFEVNGIVVAFIS